METFCFTAFLHEQELFDAAKKYQPHLKRGTYFSLPEFFNPAFKYNYTVYHGSFQVGM